MTEYAKASLRALRRTRAATRREPARFEVADSVEVQFNPASLQLSHRNDADAGGVTTRAQRRQHAAVQPARLTFALDVDTAEERQPDGRGAVDVRTRTAAVRRFVEVARDDPRVPPPLVQFQWGTFVFTGRVTEVSETLDYFAPDGTPLRASLSVSVTEQDLRLEANEVGPGARDARTATAPGGVPAGRGSAEQGPRPGVDPPTGAGPGQAGTRQVEQVVPALAGESLQGLASRLDGDPSTWRSLATGVTDPLALPAGQPVAAGVELRGTGVLGAGGVGPGAGAASTDVAESARLALAAGAARSATERLAAGLALARASGLTAVSRAGEAETALALAGAARSAFVPSSPDRRSPGRPSPGLLTPGARAEPDPRALAYGRGVPLRTRAFAPTVARIAAGGRTSLAARAGRDEAPSGGTATPPWEGLRSAARDRAAADGTQRDRDARRGRLGRYGRRRAR